jgi:PKD repeat protein/plastocyanin
MFGVDEGPPHEGRSPWDAILAEHLRTARLPGAIALLGVLLLLAPAAATDVDISMMIGNQYNSSAGYQVAEGDRVNFTHDDPTPNNLHNAVAETGEFQSPDLHYGESWATTATVAHTILFYCTYHDNAHGHQTGGMNAYLTVINLPPQLTFDIRQLEGWVGYSNMTAWPVYGRLDITGTASDVGLPVPWVNVSLDGGVRWYTAAIDGLNWRRSFDISGMAHGSGIDLAVQATDDDQAPGSTVEYHVPLRVDQPPTAGFAVEPEEPTGADSVQFIDQSTDPDTDGIAHGVAAWSWDFGDGSGSTLASPAHRFAPGTYRVRLNVTDDDGARSWDASRFLTVRDAPPAAAFATQPPNPRPGEAVTFTDLSQDPDGSITSLFWDFGDGATGTGRNATHAFADAGTFQVTLTVRDDAGLSATAGRAIIVAAFQGQRPVARLAASSTSGEAPLSVRFTIAASDADGSVASWNLDFGDGDSSQGTGAPAAGLAVPHVYASAGDFDAELRVLDETGLEGLNRSRVHVEPRPDNPPRAAFEASALAVAKGQEVRFTDRSSDPDAGDRVASWSWDFGDGTRACCAVAAVAHTYTHARTFNATVTVTDLAGHQATAPVQAIRVSGRPPSAVLTATVTVGPPPLAVQLVPTAWDDDGRVASWTLDFGDGSPALRGEGPPPDASIGHLYAAAGSFSARFEVVDDDGLRAEQSVLLAVSAAGPAETHLPPGAVVVEEDASDPASRAFTSGVAMAGNVSYRWDFGDGATAAGREVRHTYGSPGAFTATLTVLRDGAVVGTAAASVVVGGRAPPSAALEGNGIRVSWLPQPGAVSYQVWRARGGMVAELRGEVGNATFLDADVQDATGYQYSVTVVGAGGAGRLARLDAADPQRLLGTADAVATVDTDGDGVRDIDDAFPLDAQRSRAEVLPFHPLWLAPLPLALAGLAYWKRASLRAALRGGAPPATSPPPGAKPMPGTSSKRYRFVASLPPGAFGNAHVAEDLETGRKVVVKRLLPQWWLEPKIRSSFLREGRIAMRIDHPNIVKVFEVDTTRDTIVMEYVEGGNLEARLEQGPLPPGEALRIAEDVLHGLERVHREGIVHRDLKPANILLTREGRAKVSDFGVAHVPESQATIRLSGSGYQPGTPLYMAPEQVLNEPPDATTDLYALSAVLHEMLTGKHYLGDKSLREYDLRRGIVEGPARLDPALPAPLRRVLERGLARERGQRFRDAEEMHEALQDARRELGLGATRP